MSAPLAGKFQDHYGVLGIDPKSDAATIRRVYEMRAQDLDPRISRTGDPAKFEALVQAFEVLSDPHLRRDFDKLMGLHAEEDTPGFSGAAFFDALKRQCMLRSVILSLLYDRRRTHPSVPSMSVRDIEGLLSSTSDEISFVIWYLKQRSLVSSNDKSALQITVDGMDYLENNQPAPEDVMPFFKQYAPEQPTPADNLQEPLLTAVTQ